MRPREGSMGGPTPWNTKESPKSHLRELYAALQSQVNRPCSWAEGVGVVGRSKTLHAARSLARSV